MKRERQRQKLAAWLKEWEIDRAFGEATPEAMRPTFSVPRNRPFSLEASGETLEEGDIILLPPFGPFTAKRPVYVALVRTLEGGRWEVVPFSRFTVPATEGEWSTGREAIPLKVLCPWNRGQLLSETLRAGWKVERLNVHERERLLESLSDHPGENLLSDSGPPLIHPLDPRIDYLETERELWFEDERGEYPAADLGEETTSRAADPYRDDYR